MTRSHRHRYSFTVKIIVTASLIIAGDRLFFGIGIGSTLGLFALLWAITIALTRPATRRGRAGIVALLAAIGFALVLIDDPSLLGWCLFWVAISTAALLPRRRFDDSARWAVRLMLHVATGIPTPILDADQFAKIRKGDARVSRRGILTTLALPLIGSAVFIALFANANPLIGQAFGMLALPNGLEIVGHAALCIAIAFVIWPSLRPHKLATGEHGDMLSIPHAPLALPLATIVLSLAAFNIVFALQNALDIVFLWSGAPLPGTITMADYAHRGAYALIATALLAGLFVLVVLDPSSAAAQSKLARRLVVLWVAQNVLLVASSILRTLDYVAAYSLTVLRLSALAWMGLVAIGLVLICWRVLSGRSARWLINANALAGILVLIAASVIDLGATAAAWNVRHNRALGTGQAALDLCYLNRLGPAALLPLVTLEQATKAPILHDRIVAIRVDILAETINHQADWHRWTWRNARRLAAAQTALGPHPAAPARAPNGRGCDGAIQPPPAQPALLTPEPEQ